MPKLFLLRHLQSQWNLENRFAGWVDNPLSEEGAANAKGLAQKIAQEKFGVIYTSSLFRNMDTVARIFEFGNKKYPIFMRLDKGRMKDWGHFTDVSENDVPVFVTESLNERYYGELQGRNRDVIKEKYGEKQFQLWRRSFDVRPPGGESLKDTYNRTIPFFKKNIEKDLKSGKNVLLVGSHNALRSIAKYLEKISDNDIAKYEIPYGGIIEYDLDENLALRNKKIT